jgi:bifunctional non-homologous end joining protein LigD
MGDYAYELKWDGFRCLVSTVGRLRILSRQWWEMTPHLPELADLPSGLALDGELIAFGDDGKPSFPRLCERMLHGHEDIRPLAANWTPAAVPGLSPPSQAKTVQRLTLSGTPWDTLG